MSKFRAVPSRSFRKYGNPISCRQCAADVPVNPDCIAALPALACVIMALLVPAALAVRKRQDEAASAAADA